MRLFIILASLLAKFSEYDRKGTLPPSPPRDFDWVLFGVFVLMFAVLICALATSGAPMPDELTGVVR